MHDTEIVAMTTNVNDPRVLTHPYQVKSYEAGPDETISPAVLCRRFQHVATCHADRHGFGYHDLIRLRRAWVLARLYMQIECLPAIDEPMTISTWPSGHDRLTASREFLIHDAKSAIPVRATSSWVTIDMDTRRPVSPAELIPDDAIPDISPAAKFPTRAIPRLKQGDIGFTTTAHGFDLDINNHVNNVRLVEWALEAVPEELRNSRNCTALDVQFRAECPLGEEVLSEYAIQKPEQGIIVVLHSLKSRTSDRELVRMKTWWTAQ